MKCSFCNGKYSAWTIDEHLLQCGNKTEQCPNCKKYIRRAIFAYHYENKCENFLESMKQPNANPKKPILSKFSFNIRFLFVISSCPGSQKSELEIVTCIFCNEECEIHDRIIHEVRAKT